MQVETQNVEQTIKLGSTLSSAFRGGEVVGLIGELGAGKTHLIKGIALGLQTPNTDAVTSPTFTLINEYQARLPLYHIDAYRLENPHQLESLGFDEMCHPQSVVVIEWADRVRPLLQDFQPIWIHLIHAGPTKRKITLKNAPDYLINQVKNEQNQP
ncbi:MAG: tRNA (adenosine(37)-N6)-threonylcarbamoyltransferase complex ATPase subunit type 1 TsaE [Planctomycetes bacterium]|nr:tRNA (adenosine(37)-N6)-threonylcarbamoyltransferase complex ATPase subunit type 1 TsaE [Planctomycetota bacterium]